MKKLLFTFAVMVSFTSFVNAQTKKDGTPDMRYKANKEMYGTPSYSTPSYSTPSYSTPSYSAPSSTPQRNYENGGQLKIQDGYLKSNGTYVQPHVKTTPDNNTWNNYKPKN